MSVINFGVSAAVQDAYPHFLGIKESPSTINPSLKDYDLSYSIRFGPGRSLDICKALPEPYVSINGVKPTFTAAVSASDNYVLAKLNLLVPSSAAFRPQGEVNAALVNGDRTSAASKAKNICETKATAATKADCLATVSILNDQSVSVSNTKEALTKYIASKHFVSKVNPNGFSTKAGASYLCGDANANLLTRPVLEAVLRNYIQAKLEGLQAQLGGAVNVLKWTPRRQFEVYRMLMHFANDGDAVANLPLKALKDSEGDATWTNFLNKLPASTSAEIKAYAQAAVNNEKLLWEVDDKPKPEPSKPKPKPKPKPKAVDESFDAEAEERI